MQDFYNAYHAVWRNRYENTLELDDNNNIKPQIIDQTKAKKFLEDQLQF